MRGGGAYTVEPDRRAAIAAALAEASPGDVVVIAGKGHETGQQFADHTVPFDDREVAREELAAVWAGEAIVRPGARHEGAHVADARRGRGRRPGSPGREATRW